LTAVNSAGSVAADVNDTDRVSIRRLPVISIMAFASGRDAGIKLATLDDVDPYAAPIEMDGRLVGVHAPPMPIFLVEGENGELTCKLGYEIDDWAVGERGWRRPRAEANWELEFTLELERERKERPQREEAAAKLRGLTLAQRDARNFNLEAARRERREREAEEDLPEVSVLRQLLRAPHGSQTMEEGPMEALVDPGESRHRSTSKSAMRTVQVSARLSQVVRPKAPTGAAKLAADQLRKRLESKTK
jgi:hypothetical protein